MKWEDKHTEWCKANVSTFSTRIQMQRAFENHFGTKIGQGDFYNKLKARNIRPKVRPCTRYTDEQIEWLLENYKKYKTNTYIYFNEKFGTSLSENSIRQEHSRLTREGVPKKRNRYTDEMDDFLRENALVYSYNTISDMMYEKFGVRLTKTSLSHRSWRIGIIKPRYTPGLICNRENSGRFKKGHESHNKMPIGSERVENRGKKNARVAIKTEHGWMLKSRFVWEQHHGKIPKGMAVIFLDGNTLNCDIENLALISLEENMTMTKNNLRSSDKEITKTGIAVAKLITKINDKENKK